MWPLMEIKPLERMRIGKAARDVHEAIILLRPGVGLAELDSVCPARPVIVPGAQVVDTDTGDKMAELLAENKRLRAGLDKAVKINERMWNGIVDHHLVPESNGHT